MPWTEVDISCQTPAIISQRRQMNRAWAWEMAGSYYVKRITVELHQAIKLESAWIREEQRVNLPTTESFETHV